MQRISLTLCNFGVTSKHREETQSQTSFNLLQYQHRYFAVFVTELSKQLIQTYPEHAG